MHVGEISDSPHNIKTRNVYIGTNKPKIMILLYSSKMHDQPKGPQVIKISQMESSGKHQKFFCPFNILQSYMAARGEIENENEPFFALSDKSPLLASQLRNTLHRILSRFNNID